MEMIDRYFPDLTPLQRERFEVMGSLYAEWNARINVISRKDIEHFEVRHLLHSLAPARVWEFAAGAQVMDIGTGGGFPGIPLAVMFPEVNFTLVDSIGKKITVVREVARVLGLENVRAINGRAEIVDGRFDAVVTRAVAPMGTLWDWVARKTDTLIALKGGDLAEELAASKRPYTIYNIVDFFPEVFFETKKVVISSTTSSPGKA